MVHLLVEAENKIRELKQSDYLLTKVDEVARKGTVAGLAVDEVNEVIAALEENYLEEAAAEVGDVLVFYFSLLFAKGEEFDVVGALGNVNGYGKHSNALEELRPVILDSEYEPRAIPEVLARIWSLALWNPYAMQGIKTIDSVIAKVQANYPQELFAVYDPTVSRLSNSDEVFLRYSHMKAGLRLIRNDVQRTLIMADWKPYEFLLQNWQQSEWALAQMSAQLAASKQVQIFSGNEYEAQGRINK